MDFDSKQQGEFSGMCVCVPRRNRALSLFSRIMTLALKTQMNYDFGIKSNNILYSIFYILYSIFYLSMTLASYCQFGIILPKAQFVSVV